MTERVEFDRLAKERDCGELSRRALLQRFAIGAGAISLAGWSTVGPVMAQDADSSGGEVRMLIRKPVTLNPLFSTSGNEQQIERAMFGALVKMTDELEPVPDLAETVDVSPDARVYTFTLREGLAFNDGEPLTASDVVFTIERAVDARTGSLWRGRLLAIEGAEAYGDQAADTISGIETPDERTISITLAEPDASFLVTLGDYTGLGILPRHILGELAPDALANQTFLEPSVGAGPYELVTYAPDQFIELRRNERYGGDPPLLDRILLPIRTPEIAIAEMERGEIDLMRLPFEEVEGAREIPNVSVVSVQSPSMDHLVVNNRQPYLQDNRVRQAMMYAIDRQGIVDAILQGEAEIVNSPIFGPAWMGIPDGLEAYPYDVEKAKQLLADAGWDESQEVVALIVDDVPMAPIVQTQLQDAGIRLELLQVEITELVRRISADPPEFDIFFNGGDTYRADPNISALFYSGENLSPAGTNFSGYANPDLDQLYEEGRATADQEERQRIYTEAAQILNADVPNIFLWSPNSFFAVNDRVEGFAAPGYSDNRLWNVEEWSVSS